MTLVDTTKAEDTTDNTPAAGTTIDALAGVTVVYCAEARQAHRLLAEMVGAGRVAIDIETAPSQAEVDRLARLTQARAETAGELKALRKLKAPASEIANLAANGKQLDAEIRYAKTAGLDPRRAHIRLLQVYNGGDRVLVIDLYRTGTGVLGLLEDVSVVAHNMAFELAFLEQAGVGSGELQCTLQATRLTLGENATSLADSAATYLNLNLDKSQQVSDWSALRLTPQQIDYAAIDAAVAWRIAEKILPRFDVQRSAYEIQMRAVPAVMRMESRGFKLDVEAHMRLLAELEQEREAAAQEYREACLVSGHTALAGQTPSTPAQKEALLTALLSSEELQRWRRTEKSGALSTKRSELMRAGHYPPILALVKLSRLDKLMTSFGQTMTALVSPVTGRIHAHYRVASTASGRASCAGPNLQQIPHDRRFMALFIPEPGHVLGVADYSSMELRAAAHISGDREMASAFEQGLDLHRITASRVTGKDPAQVTDEERKGAKAVNFGGIYGQGAVGLVQSAWTQFDLVLDLMEAKAWLRAFESAYRGFAQWRRDHYQRCEDRRFILIGKDAERGIGRVFPKSRVPEGKSYYTRCCNLPVQGACADAAMLALALVDDRLFDAGIDGGLVGWLHDEFIIEVRENQAERAAGILKQSMIDGFAETFPGAPLNGLVDPHIGPNWGEAKVKSTIASGATQSFRPCLEPDFALVYAERVELLRRDVGEAEARARTIEHVVAARDGARPSAGVAMSRSASQTAVGAFREADIGRGRPAGFPEASAVMTFYEFFAGAGMARAGLGAEWECLLANDNDQRKGAAYVANWTADRLIVGDVGALTVADLPGVADFAWASPPCQDLSLAGDRAGLDAARSGSFCPFMKLMQRLRAQQRQPRLIVIENVMGLLTSHGGKDFDAVCAALADAGYRFGAVAIDASLFVPQSRERVFIVAVDVDVHVPAELVADEPTAPFHPPALMAACRRQRDPLWWRLPIPPKRNTTLADIVEDEPTGVPWHIEAETERLIGMMSPTNIAKVDAAKRAGKRMVGGLYRRIRPDADGKKVQRAEIRFDDVAGCLRVPTGGSSRQTIVIVEGVSVRSRLLSPREAARLMGVAEDYALPANYNEAYHLIGDGVAVPVVRFLASHILEPILAANVLAVEGAAQ